MFVLETEDDSCLSQWTCYFGREYLVGFGSLSGDESPLATGGPVVVGAVLAALLTWVLHSTLNWHTTLVTATPALLAVGGVGVLVAAETVRRLGLPAWAFGVSEVVSLAAAAFVLQTTWPAFRSRLTRSLTERL